MAKQTSTQPATIATKPAPRRGASQSAPSRKAAPSARKPARPASRRAYRYPPMTKSYGDEAVQAYFATIRDWKQSVVRRLDAIITRTAPAARKAVRGESPFYGIPGQGWFLSYHCFGKYVKVTFYRGTSLRPVPAGKARHPEARYLDIYKDEKLDQPLFTRWVKQASEVPGVRM